MTETTKTAGCAAPGGRALVFPFLAPVYGLGTCLAWPMVRFFAGIVLVPHGANKLFGFWGGSVEGTAHAFGQMGFEPALPLALLVAFTEFFGGLMIAFGFLTRIAAAAATIFLFTSAFGVHLGNGFWWTEKGYEYPMLWGVVTLAIFFRGGGAFSIDSRLPKEI